MKHRRGWIGFKHSWLSVIGVKRSWLGIKRSWIGVIALALVLFLQIVCTQQTVNAFFYEKYRTVLVFAALNVLLFPVSLWIYRKERDRV